LRDPAGMAQLLFAVNHIRLVTASAPRTDLAPAYVDERTAAIVNGLKQWGFNAFGGDADADIWHRGLPFIESLEISRHLQAVAQTPAFDVYAPTFPAQVEQIVSDACAPRAQDSELIGYISDQGLDWDPVLHPAVVLKFYLSLPLQAPGRQRAMDYLRLRYNDDIRPLNRAWGTRAKDFTELSPPPTADSNPAFVHDAQPFAEQVLVRYLQTAANAIHQADPNHLYLGANLAANPQSLPRPESNLALAWNIPDVASFLAPATGVGAFLASLTTVVHKPLLVSFEGCAGVVPDAGLFHAASLIGYVWTPAPDWQAPPCAAMAASPWRRLNQTAAAGH
ncbi:MAG: hypothetical protein ACRD2D_14350, partial [Terriglobales bacterium]